MSLASFQEIILFEEWNSAIGFIPRMNGCVEAAHLYEKCTRLSTMSIIFPQVYSIRQMNGIVEAPYLYIRNAPA